MGKKIQNQTSNKDKSNIKKQSSHDTYLKQLLPISPFIILIFFLPFIVRLNFIPLEGAMYEYWTGERVNGDFFTYYKQIFIYILTFITSIVGFFSIKKIKKTKAYYFIGGFSILVILSTIFSNYPQIALHGFVERREGMWVVLCYMMLIFLAINLIDNEFKIKSIVYSLGFSGLFISIISIFQFYGLDIFATEWIKSVIISKEIMSNLESFTIKFGEGYSYGVFYNPNYLGGYMSFYSPLMLGYAIFSKDIKEKIIFGIFFVLSIFALAFSRSEAGVLGTISAILFMLTFIYIKYLLQNREKEEYTKVLITRLVPIFLAIVIIPLSISYVPMERNPLERIRKEAIELLTPNKEKIDYKEVGPINDIKKIDDRNIELTIYNTTTRLNVDENMNLRLYDSVGEILFEQQINPLEDASYRIENLEEYLAHINIKTFENEEYYGITYYYNDKWERLNFLVLEDEILPTTFSFRILYDKELEPTKAIGFEGKGNLASGRGYIWSRSFPIMLNNFIIGSGQDTFVTEFQQFDIYGRQAEGFRQSIWETITDKPHSIYIQIGIQSGFISLILVLIGFAILHIKGLKKYLNINDNQSIVITSSIFGWLISSIFNDSIIGITPIVMIFIGVLSFLTIDIKIKDKAVKNNE